MAMKVRSNASPKPKKKKSMSMEQKENFERATSERDPLPTKMKSVATVIKPKK